MVRMQHLKISSQLLFLDSDLVGNRTIGLIRVPYREDRETKGTLQMPYPWVKNGGTDNWKALKDLEYKVFQHSI